MEAVRISKPAKRKRERERVHVKAEPPLASNASPEQQGRRRGLLVAFCHGKTRTSEPLCVLESGDALLARVASMQNAPCSILDMPFAVSVGDYDGSLRCVERFRGKWQVKRLVRLMILFSQDQGNSRRFFICRLDVLEISSNIFDSIFFSKYLYVEKGSFQWRKDMYIACIVSFVYTWCILRSILTMRMKLNREVSRPWRDLLILRYSNPWKTEFGREDI